jgi:hypothetical protein
LRRQVDDSQAKMLLTAASEVSDYDDLIETKILPSAVDDGFAPSGGVMRMTNTMKIDVALTNLEAGKFSFRMVDAIKDHISSLEGELEILRGLHDSAICDLKLQKIANWRQEGELRKLNARIYTLLKANMLTEKFYGGITSVVMKMGEYFEVSRQFAGATLERGIADLKAGKLKSQLVDSNAKIYALLKEVIREMTPYAHKMGEYLEVFKKYVGTSLEKASAYVSTLHKTAA